MNDITARLKGIPRRQSRRPRIPGLRPSPEHRSPGLAVAALLFLVLAVAAAHAQFQRIAFDTSRVSFIQVQGDAMLADVQSPAWLWRSTDRGRTWVPKGPAAFDSLSWGSIGTGPNYDTIYADAWRHQDRGGNLIELHRSTDGGATWELRSVTSNPVEMIRYYPYPGNAEVLTRLVVTESVPFRDDHLDRSDDGGRTWRTILGPLYGGSLHGGRIYTWRMSAVDTGLIAVVVSPDNPQLDESVLYVSSDGGWRWRVKDGQLFAHEPSYPLLYDGRTQRGELYFIPYPAATGGKYYLWHSIDYGSTWIDEFHGELDSLLGGWNVRGFVPPRPGSDNIYLYTRRGGYARLNGSWTKLFSLDTFAIYNGWWDDITPVFYMATAFGLWKWTPEATRVQEGPSGSRTLLLAGLWPNPTSGRIDLLLKGDKDAAADVSVTDYAGRSVALQKVLLAGDGGTHATLDLRHLSTGAYRCTVRTGRVRDSRIIFLIH